jgi:hypothetical protein
MPPTSAAAAHPAVTEIVKLPNRGHSLTIDHGWREVAQTALDFVKRFAKSKRSLRGDDVLTNLAQLIGVRDHRCRLHLHPLAAEGPAVRRPFRRFLLVRQFDVSGVSGTGPVAEGSQWSSGKAALNWLSEVTSSGVYDSVDDVLTVHTHDQRLLASAVLPAGGPLRDVAGERQRR